MVKKSKRVQFICAACGAQFYSLAEVDRHDPSHPRIVTTLEQGDQT